MAKRLHSYLAKVARKLLLTRSAEAFAVGAIGAGLAGVCIMGAWILAGRHPWWATLLAAAALATVLPVAPERWRRRLGAVGRLEQRWRIPRPVCWTVAATAAAAAAVACFFVHTGRHADLPHGWIPLAVIPAGGLLAAITVMARGVSVRDAALYIDLRANLGERMITALEVTADDDSGFADTVCEHALAAAGQHQPHRLGFWRRGRATAGVLCLTAAAVTLLAFLAPLDAAQRDRLIAQQRAREQLALQLAEQAAKYEQMNNQTASRQFKQEVDRLNKLSQDIRWGKIPPNQAMSELNRLQDEHRKALQSQDALRAAIDRLKASEMTRQLAPSADASDESFETKAAEFADEAAGQMDSGDMSDTRRGQMSQALNEAADAAEGNPELAAALRQAAEMVDRNNAQAFRDAMAQTGKAMGDTQREAAAAQAHHEAINDYEQHKNQLAQTSGGRRGLTAEDFRQAADQTRRRMGGQGRDGQGAQGQGGQGQGGQGQGGQGQGGQGQDGQGSGTSGDEAGGGNPGGSGVAAGAGSTNRDAGSGTGGRYEGPAFQEGRWTQIYAPKTIEHEGPQISPTGSDRPDQPGRGPARGSERVLRARDTRRELRAVQEGLGRSTHPGRRRSEPSEDPGPTPPADPRLLRRLARIPHRSIMKGTRLGGQTLKIKIRDLG